MSTTTDTQNMPLLVIEASGKIIKSNFDAFAVSAREWISGLNLNLRTDEDFEQAGLDAKKAKETEDLLSEVHRRTLESAVELNDELAKLNSLSAEMRDVRLKLTKQIDTAKDEMRKFIIEGALAGIDCDRSMREVFRPLIENSIKGMKSLDSMREKSRIAAQIANDKIARNRKELDLFEKANGTTMTADRVRLEVEENAALAPELERRLERYQAEERQKKLREEAARQVAEAKAKEQAAEMALQLERGRQAERENGKTVLVNAGPSKSDPASVTDMPWDTPTGPTPAEEWGGFRALVVAAFGPLKPFREAMIHPANREAAAAFGEAVNAAWSTANRAAKAALGKVEAQ